MNSIVLLVSGPPGAGKTYLASHLQSDHSFEVLSLDELYVEFIKSDCRMLYFEALDKYIGPHYDSILAHRDYSRSQFGRDFVAEWHSHVLSRARERAAGGKSVVVEGYLLRDWQDKLQAGLEDLARVFRIVVENRRYWWLHERLTIEQVAGLGADPSGEGRAGHLGA